MGKKAYLKVEQLAHFAPSNDRQVHYGISRFTVMLCFDGESKWLMGRCPDLAAYANYDSLYCIYLPSLFLTRTLGCIHSTKTVYNDIHVLQALNDKQIFIDSTTNNSFTSKPLRNNDRFQIQGMPFYNFKYLCIEDSEPSGDLQKDTVY